MLCLVSEPDQCNRELFFCSQNASDRTTEEGLRDQTNILIPAFFIHPGGDCCCCRIRSWIRQRGIILQPVKPGYSRQRKKAVWKTGQRFGLPSLLSSKTPLWDVCVAGYVEQSMMKRPSWNTHLLEHKKSHIYILGGEEENINMWSLKLCGSIVTLPHWSV